MHSGGRIEKASGGEQVIGGNECSGGGEASGGLRGGGRPTLFPFVCVCAAFSFSVCVDGVLLPLSAAEWVEALGMTMSKESWGCCVKSQHGAWQKHPRKGGNRFHTCSLESHLWISSVMNFTFRVLTYWLSCYVTNQYKYSFKPLRIGTLIYCIAQPQCLQFRHHCHQ